MPDRKMFNRLAKRLYYSGISIDRITWLNGVGEDENGVRDYLEDDVLNRTEERIEETFGKEQGAFLNSLCDEGDTDEAVDEILRQDGYLGKTGSNRNVPTQKAMDLGLFRIKETAITHSDGHVTINRTAKVTGKGQRYFIARYCPKKPND